MRTSISGEVMNEEYSKIENRYCAINIKEGTAKLRVGSVSKKFEFVYDQWYDTIIFHKTASPYEVAPQVIITHVKHID